MGVMRQFGVTAALLASAVACQQAPSDLLEEFPPPRLASDAPLHEAAHCHLDATSEAHLTLRSSGVWRGELDGAATGWLALPAGASSPSGGHVEVDLGGLREGSERTNPLEVWLASTGDDNRVMKLDWSTRRIPGQREGIAATLVLNSHRSEVLLDAHRRRRARDDDSKGVAFDLRTPRASRLPLADHGLQLSAPNKAGTHLTAVDAADLHLRLKVHCDADGSH